MFVFIVCKNDVNPFTAKAECKSAYEECRVQVQLTNRRAPLFTKDCHASKRYIYYNVYKHILLRLGNIYSTIFLNLLSNVEYYYTHLK